MCELRLAHSARLVPPRAHGVQPDHAERRRAEDGLGRLPVPLELGERAREARREGVRDVVVPGDRDHGRAERAQEGGRCRVLLRASPVRQVAARDDELGRGALDQSVARLRST